MQRLANLIDGLLELIYPEPEPDAPPIGWPAHLLRGGSSGYPLPAVL